MSKTDSVIDETMSIFLIFVMYKLFQINLVQFLNLHKSLFMLDYRRPTGRKSKYILVNVYPKFIPVSC